MGCGTWSWGNQLLWGYEEEQDGELRSVFEYTVEEQRKIEQTSALFDTGDSYGTGKLNGRSEALLGEFRKDLIAGKGADVGDRCLFATKLATYPWRLTRGSLVKACEGSLERLQVDQIDLCQLHWPASNYNPLQERALWEGIGDIHDKGLAKAVGVSNYGPKQLVKINRYLKERGVPLATCQVQFSLLSYGSLQKEVLATCEDLGITVISYSPLALGLLTNKYSRDRPPPGLRKFALRKVLERMDPLRRELAAVAEDCKASPAQVAITWCCSKNTVPIPGAKNLDQAMSNRGALDVRLSEQHCQALEASAALCSDSMVQNIFQSA